MRDEMNHNGLVISGTPTLVAGALTVDPDQALAFDGSTNAATAFDSASLSITGSLSVEFFLRLTAYPGSDQYVVTKSGSYGLIVGATGYIAFVAAGLSGSGTAVSNAPLQLNRWYHIVCVYNGNYLGAAQFGKTTIGSTLVQVDDENGYNKAVSRFSLLEPALLNTVNVSLQYRDEIWNVEMCAVVYADNQSVPGVLVSKSDVVLLTPPNPQYRVATWVSFPLTKVVVPAGSYHLGYVANTIADISKVALWNGSVPTGGATFQRADAVSGPSDPFGAPSSTSTNVRDIYCDYTAVGRTGREGKVLLYIDGALNSSAVYSGGVADSANALQICNGIAAQVDELSVWNKALSDVQIATHYNAH